MPIDKGLENLPKLAVEKIYERIKEATCIDESTYDKSDRDTFSTKVVEFNFFVRKANPFLK